MRTSSSTRSLRRVFALLATALALVLSFGVTNARADDFPPDYPQLDAYTGKNEQSYDILIKKGAKTGSGDTWLFAIHTEGQNSAIRGYCTEINVDARDDARTYEIKNWEDFPGTNQFATKPEVRPKVAWIVANSFPENDLEEVVAMVGADIKGLTKKEAITATQAAIWYFTDGWDLTGLREANNGPVIDDSTPEAMRVKKLYDYLVDEKNNVGSEEADGPTLSATGPDKPGKPGELVGPIHIKSNVKTAEVVDPDTLPYPLVTADGTKVDPKAIPTGVDLFLKVPAGAPDGMAELKVEVTGGAYTGKILVDPTEDDPKTREVERSQTIMISGSLKQTTLDAKVKVSWKADAQPTPEPTPDKPKLELPETGA